MRDFLRRRLGLILIGLVVLLILSANRIAVFLTDLWWFDALRLRSVYTTVLTSQVILGVVFGLALGALVAGNLLIARRIRPFFIPSTTQQAAVERYRQMADPYLPWIILAIAAVFAITAGFAVAGEWQPFMLWRHAQPFGVSDPQFGRDVGFYVFKLPWLKFVQTWLFTSLLLTALLTAGAHYLLGGIRPEAQGEKVMPNVKVHLSVLLALLLAARGWGYWLDRFMLNFSPRGQVTGASYTDVHAELPALNLLLAVTAVAILITLWNVRRRGWLLPGAAIGLLVLASILLQGAYPAAIQRLRVDPQELARESEFITKNLDATRTAFSLDDTTLEQFEVKNDLDQAQVNDNEVTVDNIRLWDPQVLQTTYSELQALRPYYQFTDVDIDRYTIDGTLRQILLSARELQQSGLPDQAQTWQNLRLTYTHGLGIVASRANTSSAEGQPVFVAQDIPPKGVDDLVPNEKAGIYYGEVNPAYSIVNTGAKELDYEESGTANQITTTYTGTGGVEVGNIGSRLLFAVRFSDPNFVLSSLLKSDSKVLYRRDVTARVRAVAPYLLFDRDPYPVVIGGRIKWVVDGYATSDYYPYSQRELLRADRTAEVNYVRNSVKAVVDAYDGDVTLYVVDPSDPVVTAWSQAFPDAYKPVADAPDGLKEHFRYPQDLFETQSRVFSTYHIPAAAAFYSKADAWDIPRDASLLANRPQVQPETAPMEPYYLLMRLPGEEDEEFVLIQPYLARQKPNMISWLAARSDPAHYGELLAVQFPSDQSVLGPQQAQARIEQTSEISQFITLRDQAGSKVIRGNLLVIPIEQSILYVEPLFIENQQAQIPELSQVVLVMGDRVVMEPTLPDALAKLIGSEPPSENGGGGGQPPSTGGETGTSTADQLLLQALQAFTDAEAALQSGDLGTYQSKTEEARNLVEQAARARDLNPQAGQNGQPGGASPTPQPSGQPATEPTPAASPTAGSG